MRVNRRKTSETALPQQAMTADRLRHTIWLDCNSYTLQCTPLMLLRLLLLNGTTIIRGAQIPPNLMKGLPVQIISQILPLPPLLLYKISQSL